MDYIAFILAGQGARGCPQGAATAAVTVETALKGTAGLKLEIDSTLDRLSEALVEQAKRLAQIEEAVAIRTRQMAELYDIEVAADTPGTCCLISYRNPQAEESIFLSFIYNEE